MKKFLVAIAFIILGVFLSNTFITGKTDTMKTEGDRIGKNMVNNMKEVEKAGTIYTP